MTLTELFFIIAAFLIIFMFRYLCIKRKKFVFIFHVLWILFSIVAVVGGRSVQNLGYECLEKFKEFENNHTLEQARISHPDEYLRSYLIQFESADQFEEYLKSNALAWSFIVIIVFGWLLVLLCDTVMMCVLCIRYIKRRATS